MLTSATVEYYFFTFSDLKLLDSTLPRDKVTERALRYKRKFIDIYSNSWGPHDNGQLVRGPGAIVKRVLKRGVEKVRLHNGTFLKI